jgi:hypothetical protein
MVSPETYIEGPWSMGMIIPNAVEHEKNRFPKHQPANYWLVVSTPLKNINQLG